MERKSLWAISSALLDIANDLSVRTRQLHDALLEHNDELLEHTETPNEIVIGDAEDIEDAEIVLRKKNLGAIPETKTIIERIADGDYVSRVRLSELSGVSIHRIFSFTKEGVLPHIRFRNKYYYPKSTVELLNKFKNQ